MDVAAYLGLECVKPRANELFIDLDTPSDRARFHDLLLVALRNGVQFQTIRETRSKSGNGWHVYLQSARDFDATERVAWQACLGSDRVRELLSLIRVCLNHPTPTVFFEVPEPPPVSARNVVVRESSEASVAGVL